MVKMVIDPNSVDLKSEQKCLRNQLKKSKKLLRKIQKRIDKLRAKVHIDDRDSGFYMKINELRRHENHLIKLIDILTFDEKSSKHFHIDRPLTEQKQESNLK